MFLLLHILYIEGNETMHQIEITEQNYRRLQAFAKPFEETVNDAIGKTLDIAEHILSGESPIPPGGGRNNMDLITTYGPIPHKLKLRTHYKGAEYHAEINNGSVEFAGNRFPSLSKAAVAVIQSTGSNRPTENGWRFWQYYNPVSEQWQSAEQLKKSSTIETIRAEFLGT